MDERVNIVTDAFKSTIKTQNLKIFFLIVVIFILLGLGLYYIDKIKEFINHRYLKRLFFIYAQDLGLTKEEAQLLWNYSKKLKRDPFLVLEFKAPFEKVIDLYIKENPNFDEKLIRRIRRKLGFDKIPPYVPLISTKDIDIYQTGNLISPNKQIYPVALYDKDELFTYWWVIDKKPPFDFEVGSKVKIRFIRKDDAIYSFEETIQDIIHEDGKYIVKLPHTFKLESINRREEFRLREHIPIILELETKEGKKVKINTETTDISIEGFGFCLPILEARDKKLSVETKIKAQLKIDNRTIKGEAVIKNVREVGKKLCFGAKFDQIDKEDKEFLKTFISEKQKEILKQYRGKYIE
ncbi:MAG: PilZ domain-containing protein [Aquificae bacterium]|nr:PilZ domain-containing protein [Aquificota bacterium]